MINNFIKRLITSGFLILLFLYMFYSVTILIISLIILSTISWFEINQLFVKIFKKKIYVIFFSALSLLYLFLFVSLIFYAVTRENSIDQYKLFVFYSILISINVDIGGYISGNIFKGKKLTKISPKKTISGSIGSFVFAICLVPFFISEFQNISLNYLILSTFIISLISQIGDLFFSYLKRLAKIKNTGNYLPGHGGIIDRIDGILFSVPTGFLIFNLY